MDTLYPNFYSLTSVSSEPLDPRVRRRSLIWSMTTNSPIINTQTTNNNVSNNNSNKIVLHKTLNDNINILPPNMMDYYSSQNNPPKNSGLSIRRRSASHNPIHRKHLSSCTTSTINDQLCMQTNLSVTKMMTPGNDICNHHLSQCSPNTLLTSLPLPPLPFSDSNVLESSRFALPQTLLPEITPISSSVNNRHLLNNSVKDDEQSISLSIRTPGHNTLSPPRSRRIFYDPTQTINTTPHCPITPIMALKNTNQLNRQRSSIIKGDHLPNQECQPTRYSQYPVNNTNSMEKYELLNCPSVNEIASSNNRYWHRSTYSTPEYPTMSNLGMQSAVSLQSLDKMKSNQPPGDNLTSGCLLTDTYDDSSQKRNILSNCHYQMSVGQLPQNLQQPLSLQQTDLFTRPSLVGSSSVKNSNLLLQGNEPFVNLIPPIHQSNSLNKSRIRPMERRRYTQYGISYHNNEFESKLAGLKQQQCTTTPQVLIKPYRLIKDNGNRLENSNSLTTGLLLSDLQMNNNNEIQTLENIRRRRPVNTRRAHVVSAFEQSLTDMSQRLQNLSNTTTKKDSELHELKATIDALRNQTEIGLLKKPPINQPCELNRSSTKDTLKQENTLTNTTNTHNSNTTGNGQASLTNSSLTTSHSSLTDVESQQSHIDKVPTNASVKSSGSNVKRNGWLRNSLGKAFRKKTSSSMNSQNDLDCSTSLQHHSAYSFNSSPQHHHSYLPPCHPSNLPQSPTMDHKGLHVTTNVCQSNSSQSFGHNNSNALSVTSNAHLNGLSPSNSSTSSSSWSTSGISANGQNSSNTANTIPHTNEQVDRLNNIRTVQQQHHHQRPMNIDQLNCPNYSGNYNASDKLDKPSIGKGKETKNGPNNNDSKLESNQQSWQDEMNHLKYQLAEKESKLTDVQLEALASAHQLDQLKDEMSRLYTELKYLRTDNERLQILVTHLQQHQQDTNNTNQKLLFMNNGNIIMNNATTTTTTNNNNNNNLMMMSTRCNSLPQPTLSSVNLKRNSLGLDDTRSNPGTDSMIPNQRITCSNLFIELPETASNPKYITVLVNLILTNPDHSQYNHNHPFNSSTNSILYIGVLYLSKLDTWESLNNTIENLYKLYTTYLNLNDEHDLQINEFKQYHQHIDILNSTGKFKSNENLTHYSIHFNKNIIENSQKLTNLSIQLHSEQMNVIQLSIEHFPLDIEQMNLSFLNNLNNLMIKTMLNYEILYFYLELLTTYHCIILNDTDEMYMNTLIHAFCDHICSCISSTSFKVHHFNLSADEQQKTMNELFDCLSHHMNSIESIEQETIMPTLKEKETPTNSIILFIIQSMNQISDEDYVKIMNYFKVFYTENKDNSTRTCFIYLIGTWITSIDSIASIDEFNRQTSSTFNSIPLSLQKSLTSIKMISYPIKYNSYKPVQCFNELICCIKIEHSIKCVYTIRCLKQQLIHSLVNTLKMNLLSNSNEQQYYLNELYNQMKFFDKLINWIEKVLHYLDDFILNLQKIYDNKLSIIINLENHFINPLIFLSLPLNNPTITECWFINLWNNEIVQYVKKLIIEWSKYQQTITMNIINDPTEMIISTWPWYDDTVDWFKSSNVQNEQQQQQQQQQQGSSGMKSPCLIRLNQLVNSNVIN